MKRLSFALSALFVMTAGGLMAQQSAPALDKLFASAEHKASVEGDLKAAIEEYKRIVATAGANRAATARALLRMARAYEDLGDSEAQKIYQRIVDQFSDQKDAVTVASARLKPSPGAVRGAFKGDRAVWSGPDVDLFGTVSADGRYLTYVDWAGAENVMLRDLSANTSRPLTTNRWRNDVGYPTWSAISRDGTKAAFAWSPTATKGGSFA